MDRRYEYRCLECGNISIQKHPHTISKLESIYCEICCKEVSNIEKLISDCSFKLNFDTNY